MKEYNVTLTGQTPIIMHRDNLAFGEKVRQWARAPENKAITSAGDDRTPAWLWLGYCYHDGTHLNLDADNIMTMLREGGAKVLTGKGKETFKKGTQSGILLGGNGFDFFVGPKRRQIKWSALSDLIGNNDFSVHMAAAEANDFELLVKRARVGQAKHVRVRPMFRTWQAAGTVTVLDDEISGLTRANLQTVLKFAGALCGLGDWRPSSPSSGQFGRFTAEVKEI